MKEDHEPTTAELKEIWKRSGLWRTGHSFSDDIQRPIIVWALRKAVIAQHKKRETPDQGILI